MPPTQASLGARLFILLQHLMPQHLLSRLVYHLTRARTPAIRNTLIRSFVHSYQPDMSDAAQPDPLRYDSFNAFFTRALRAGARSLPADAQTIISPVDGAISQIGVTRDSQLLQAKGHEYSLAALLADREYLQAFRNASFATLYLAPFNYHRIHMPLAGTLRAAWYVPGKLFSVNAVTAAAVPGLFARNERIVCIFEHAGCSFGLVLVGALFVGSMATVWHGQITPRSPRRLLKLPLDASRSPLWLDKGAEMGRFNMGSTVIVLIPAELGGWLPDVAAGQAVRVGRPLGSLRVAP
ncbi:MAG: phosphatidylserine decarboxylase [Sinobacteraceae bacterium]|nr:phosphatidylserine decarboxylase [Nevskiaceae bacterium]